MTAKMNKQTRFPKNETKLRRVTADIPAFLADQCDSWKTEKGRTRPSDRAFITGLYRLFLAMSDEVRLSAIYGSDEQLNDALKS